MATRIPPPDENPSGVSYYAWRWGSDEQRRPGLPWIGIFLVVFGGLLLLEQALPQYRGLGNIAILAAGIASLIAWAFRRGTIALYAGAFLTALAAPGTLRGGDRHEPRAGLGHALLRARVPLHRGGPRRPRRRLGLAADVGLGPRPARRGRRSSSPTSRGSRSR